MSENQLQDEFCIYFRTSDHSWIIPHYNNDNSTSKRKMCYWNASGSSGTKYGEIYGLYDYKGRKEPKSAMHEDDDDGRYYAGMSVNSQDNTSYEVSIVNDGNPYMSLDIEHYESDGGIKQYDLSHYDDLAEEEADYYALWNPTAAYRMDFDDPSAASLPMEYRNVKYFADLGSADSISYDSTGCVSATGTNTDYGLTISTDEKLSVTDWDSLTVSGGGINTVELKTVKGGYLLTADNFDNVTVKAINDRVETSCSFNCPVTSLRSVYILLDRRVYDRRKVRQRQRRKL